MSRLKNYYYFLGIDSKATLEQIKASYRKLSHKYHPDKNPEDPFFTQRFTELKEAYEILSNKESRELYDKSLTQITPSIRSQFPPEIKSFTANKSYGEPGDKVIIKWNTLNADVVKLVPFGLVNAFGEKTIEIPEFTQGQFQILLHAQNTLLRKTVVQGITIYDKSHVVEPAAEKSKVKKKSDSPGANRPGAGSKKWLWLLVMMVLGALALYFLS